MPDPSDWQNVYSDVTGSAYVQLIDFARWTGSTFGLVWRDQAEFTPHALDLASSLADYLVSEVRTDDWPGTRVWGSLAWLRTYRLTDHSASILSDAQRLFAWLAPDRPEDLCLYFPDGSNWFLTVSHERYHALNRAVLGEEGLAELSRRIYPT